MVSRGLKDEALIKSPPSDVIELLPMQTNITRAGRRPIPKGIAIAGLAVLVMVIMQVFSSQGNDYHVTQLAQAGPYALAAIGTCMIFGYGGIAFLGPSIYFAIGAYGIPMWAEVGITSVPALIITLCIALIVALVLDKLLARLESFYLAIAAVAIAFIVQDLSTGLTGLTGGVNGMAVAPLSIGSASLDSNFGRESFRG